MLATMTAPLSFIAPSPVASAVDAPPADAALVAAAVAGDVTAFEALYRRHAGRVHGVIARLVGRHGARAEDLTQDAFVRAWQALPGWRGESAFGTWLHRLAVNVALMDLRARGSRPDLDGDALPDDDAFDAVRVRDSAGVGTALGLDLARAVATLPDGARTVLVLFDVEGWTHEDIAGQLGIAVGSSKAQLHRARRLLRARLEDHA